MRTWPRRIRGAVGMGLLWAAGGAGVAFVGITTLLRAVWAAGSLALARMAEERGSLVDAGADVAGAGLTEGEARELLGRSD